MCASPLGAGWGDWVCTFPAVLPLPGPGDSFFGPPTFARCPVAFWTCTKLAGGCALLAVPDVAFSAFSWSPPPPRPPPTPHPPVVASLRPSPPPPPLVPVGSHLPTCGRVEEKFVAMRGADARDAVQDVYSAGPGGPACRPPRRCSGGGRWERRPRRRPHWYPMDSRPAGGPGGWSGRPSDDAAPRGPPTARLAAGGAAAAAAAVPPADAPRHAACGCRRRHAPRLCLGRRRPPAACTGPHEAGTCSGGPRRRRDGRGGRGHAPLGGRWRGNALWRGRWGHASGLYRRARPPTWRWGAAPCGRPRRRRHPPWPYGRGASRRPSPARRGSGGSRRLDGLGQ